MQDRYVQDRYVAVPARERFRAAALFAVTCAAFGGATAIACHRLGVSWMAASLVWAAVFDFGEALGSHLSRERDSVTYPPQPTEQSAASASWSKTLAFEGLLLTAAWAVQSFT